MVAHPISDVNEWGGHPDRNYFTFTLLSILLGFFGADHFYIRSYGTAFLKIILNCFTFGLWYIWDLLQIGFDGEKVKQDGLTSPFDWIKGIGRGVFVRPGDPIASAAKDYNLYTILTFFGCLGLDKFYLGYYGQGIVKLISCFNIFLFLFGWFWVAWDWFHALFMEVTTKKTGISIPLPYSVLFSTIPTGPLFDTRLPAAAAAPALSYWDQLMKWFTSFVPSLDWLPAFPAFGVLQEVLDLFKPLFVIGQSGATIASQMKQDGETIVQGTAQTLQAAADPSRIAAAAAAAPTAPRLQRGGARPAGLGPVVAGALAALLLAGAGKGLHDYIRR